MFYNLNPENKITIEKNCDALNYILPSGKLIDTEDIKQVFIKYEDGEIVKYDCVRKPRSTTYHNEGQYSLCLISSYEVFIKLTNHGIEFSQSLYEIRDRAEIYLADECNEYESSSNMTKLKDIITCLNNSII